MSRIRNWQQHNHLSRDFIIHKCARNPKTKKDRIIKQYRYLETMISLILISNSKHEIDDNVALEEIRKELVKRSVNRWT